MTSGLYGAASGMLAAQRRAEIAANNLANQTTPGFKPDRAPARPFADVLAVARGTAARAPSGVGVVLDPSTPLLVQGALTRTDDPADLALDGRGFVMARAPGGELVLTRGGRLLVDPNGHLVDAAGNALVGDDGAPLDVGSGPVRVDVDGTVSSREIARGALQIVAAPVDARKVGDAAFAIDGPLTRDAATRALQGVREASAVDPVAETVEAMSALRAYQAAAQLVRLQDDVLAKAVNEIARL